jgi:ubiquinone/menaquinone biosynthesis C-methylase UbiE
MKAIRDPEGAEVSHLARACELGGKDILEIGCGDGKFTRQYAGMPERIFGIDPEIAELYEAKKNNKSSSSFFVKSIGEALPFPARAFDIVIFASSL